MRLERALVTGAGGVPLPAPETVSWPVVVIRLRWMSLRAIPSGDAAALSCKVVSGLRCRRDCRGATGMRCGERMQEVGGDLRGAGTDSG